MAKGVKSLKMTKGHYFEKASIKNKSMVITPNEEATFEVNEWYSGTLPAEKKKNLTWFWFNNEKKLIKSLSGVKFNITIPKNLCGSYTYYIEASLSGKYDFTSGIYVRGNCDPKILKSKWCLKNDGEDLRSREFSFGENVFLGLETHGINGKFVTVELYRLNDEVTVDKIKQWLSNKKYDPTKDDVLAKVFEKQAWVINGEINTDFTIQPSWKKGTDVNKFYVKVRDGRKYIPDNNGDYIHARYLKAKKVVPIKTDIEILNNNAPVKVGENGKKVDNPSTCRFKVLKISERGKTVEIFNEGRFIGKMDPSSKFYTIRNINYDYDKWNIRGDAKPILDEVAQFLTQLMPYVPVELGSHTDIRGTDQYNQILSEKRAKSVVDYLISKGVNKGRIHAKGYGKSKPLYPGREISETMHGLNRRTTIKFLISDNDALPMEYSMLAPNIEKPLPIAFSLNGVSTKGCYHKPQSHKKEIIILDGYKTKYRQAIKDGDNPNIKYEVYSPTPQISDFLHAFFLGSKFAHQVFINSCAYYSKTEKPTLLISTYPDSVFTYNLRMSYKEPFFWNNTPVSLVNNIIWLDKTVDFIKKNLKFLEDIGILKVNDMSQKIFEFIEEETHKFEIGLHFLYNFSDIEKRNSPAKTIDYTQEYRNLSTIALVIMYLLEIVLILFIIWITRGKGAFGRIRKFRPFFKAIDKLDDWGFEVVYPKLAENRTMYFESSMGKISRVVEVNCKADPLIGISYEKEVSLNELGKATENLKKIFDAETLANAKIGYKFKGTILADYSVNVNMGSKKIGIRDFMYGVKSVGAKLTAGAGINAGASLKDFKFTKETNIQLIPITKPTNIKFEALVDIELGGYVTYSRKFGLDYNVKGEPTGVYYYDEIYFSGLKGTYFQKVSVSTEGKKRVDTNPLNKRTPFTLIEEDTITFERNYIFKI